MIMVVDYMLRGQEEDDEEAHSILMFLFVVANEEH